MARYSEEDINKIREATDVSSIIREYAPDLHQKGRDLWACCPFHKEKSPSFKVDPYSGRWHCFGACSEGGDIFEFVMKTQNISFPEAVKFLADRAGIEIAVDPKAAAAAGKRKRLLAVCADTADFYHSQLLRSPSKAAADARDYLSKRDMGSQLAIQWRLGYAPGRGTLVTYLRSKGHRDDDMMAANVAVRGQSGSNDNNRGLRDRFFARIIFPIMDAQGQVIAFGGRVIGNNEPKYLNSATTPLFDKSRNLYGLDQAKASIHREKTALVVEGYTDVIALHSASYDYSVATLGTALTAQHVKLLGRTANSIVYVFDGDQAGMNAADRAAEHIDRSMSPEYSASPVNLDVVSLPQGTDPADLMKTEEGRAQFHQLLNNKKSLIEFALDRKLGHWDLTRPEERVKALQEAASVLTPLKGTMIASGYAQYIADALTRGGGDVSEQQVLDTLSDEAIRTTKDPASGFASVQKVSAQDRLPQLSQTELIERELLALIILRVDARRYLMQSQEGAPFTHPMYRAAFEQLRQLYANDVEYLLPALDEAIPGMAQLTIAYNFEDEGFDARQLVDSLLYRLRESALERKIRIIRSDLQKDGEDSKDHLQALADASQELHRIRAKRFQ